jgi:hypothetical protein
MAWLFAPPALTALLCAVFNLISHFDPFWAILFYPVGVLGVLLTIDAI